jgi:hypothetical protein
MRSFKRIRPMLAAALGLLALSPALRAEVPFTVMVEQLERRVDTTGFTTYEIHVTNTTADTISIHAARTVVDLPDTSWHTSVCSINKCYPEEVSILPPEIVDPNGMTGFTLHVTAGRTYGQTGRVTLRLDTGPGTEGIDIRFVIETVQPVAPLFRVTALEQNAAAGPDIPVDFMTDVYNMASDTLSVTVVRVEEYFPDATWSSALCVEDSCYGPEVEAPRPVLLAFDHAVTFHLRVTGHTPGEGRVVLRFNTSRGTDPIEKRYTVTITPTGVRSMTSETLVAGAPWPNPASRTIRIPIPRKLKQAGSRSLVIYRLDGERVADLSAELARAIASGEDAASVSVAGFNEGTYLYTLSTDRESISNQFKVVR